MTLSHEEAGILRRSPSPHYFCGIDPSIRSTGLTIISNSDLGNGTWVFPPNPNINLEISRLNIIIQAITSTLPDRSLVIMEEPMAKIGRARINLGLFWMIRHVLFEKQCMTFSMSPRSLKQFATNDGNASKKDMEKYASFDQFIMPGNDVITEGRREWNKHISDAVDSWWLAHVSRAAIFPNDYHELQVDIAGKAKLI